jgi:excisionase family DNA binding protein
VTWLHVDEKTQRGSGWLSSEQATEAIGAVSKATLYRLVERDELTGYKVNSRVFRFRREDIDDYLERSRVRPGALEHLAPRAQRNHPVSAVDND